MGVATSWECGCASDVPDAHLHRSGNPLHGEKDTVERSDAVNRGNVPPFQSFPHRDLQTLSEGWYYCKKCDDYAGKKGYDNGGPVDVEWRYQTVKGRGHESEEII